MEEGVSDFRLFVRGNEQEIYSSSTAFAGGLVWPQSTMTSLSTIRHRLEQVTQSWRQLVEQVWKWAVVRVLRVGGVPRHVAFVMDGNRRWARGRGWKVGRGHEGGFEVLKEVSDIWRRAKPVSRAKMTTWHDEYRPLACDNTFSGSLRKVLALQADASGFRTFHVIYWTGVLRAL